MREIKFRALDATTCEWVYYGTAITDTVDHLQLREDTESQYTGIKDKNGVEIYEGDILRYVWKSKIETITRDVLFIDGCFSVKEDDDCYHCLGGICSDENHEGSHVGFVIGNIYENPELLSC